MADSKISALAEKTTFGDNDFLAGTQGTGAGDNRKYGKAAIQDAVVQNIELLAVYEMSFIESFNASMGRIATNNSSNNIAIQTIDDTFRIQAQSGKNIFLQISPRLDYAGRVPSWNRDGVFAVINCAGMTNVYTYVYIYEVTTL